MKKLLLWAMVLGSILLGACTSEDDSKNEPGSIYGIVTELGTSEPMKAIGVELYKAGSLLLKTVTFDDGHYEFTELESGNYQLKIVADGYQQSEYNVVVESGRQARADMQAIKVNTHMTVRTTKIDIAGKTITLGGEYTYTENNAPIEVGFMYATQDNPKNGGTVIKAKVDNTTKSFTSILNELDKGIYYVQAYAKNSIGTAFGDILSFEIKGTPAVKTLEVTNVTAISATLNGEITYIGSPVYTERGFVYSTTMPTPTIDDKSGATINVNVPGTSKEFSVNIGNLTSDATYHVRAYVTNSNGTFYGEVQNFTPTSIMAEVKTLAATNVLANTATLNGEVKKTGSPAYTERGFVYSKSYNSPTVEDPANVTTKVVVSGTNTKYSANIASLTENTTYYFRAYATNVKGTAYGEILSFIPKAILPVVTTLETTNILATSATLHGRIDNAGEPAYTERGFLYSISYPTPTINDPSTATSKVVVGGTSKEYSANISSLKEGTTYYVRAYATSSKGTSYGEVLTFKPVAVLPSVTTLEPSNVQPTTATLNGRIDKVGEPAYTERGFVYSTSYQTPTVNNPSTATTKVVVDGSSSNYSANVSSLTENATYYVRAYATSEYGTAYGEVLSLKYENPYYVTIDNLIIQKEDLGCTTQYNAETLCKNSRIAGYSDWRLPTKNELAIMYNARDEIPNLKSENYWSSERWSPYYSEYYYINFKTGSIGTQASNFTYNVRAVRTKESK